MSRRRAPITPVVTTSKVSGVLSFATRNGGQLSLGNAALKSLSRRRARNAEMIGTPSKPEQRAFIGYDRSLRNFYGHAERCCDAIRQLDAQNRRPGNLMSSNRMLCTTTCGRATASAQRTFTRQVKHCESPDSSAGDYRQLYKKHMRGKRFPTNEAANNNGRNELDGISLKKCLGQRTERR